MSSGRLRCRAVEGGSGLVGVSGRVDEKGSNGLAVALGADEEVGADDEEDGEGDADDGRVGQKAVEDNERQFGAAGVEDVAGEVDGVTHGGDAGENLQVPGQILNGVEDPREEKLRQNDEWEDLLDGPLTAEVGDDD